MEIREIFDTIESDPNMDEELQKDILKKIENIANADKIVDGLEEKIEQHREELSEKELKYIINKCIAYKSVFYRFRNGKIVEYDHINEITDRIFQLEDSIRKNDFSVWKEELLAYKGSKEDKEEDKMLKNMLMVVPEDNVVDKVTRMFKRAMWKFQQKLKEKPKEENDVIELPQTSSPYIDINLDDDYSEEEYEDILEEQKEQLEEIIENLDITDEEPKEEETEDITEENTEEIVEDEKIEDEKENIEEVVEEEIEKEEVEESKIEDIEEPEQVVKEDDNDEYVEVPVKRTRKGSYNEKEDNQHSTNTRRGSKRRKE